MTAKVYIENRESRDDLNGCPFCGNAECTLTDHDYPGRLYVEYYECDACGRDFTEVYEYKHTEFCTEVTR